MSDRTAHEAASVVKAELRAAMRTARRSLPDQATRSEQLWRHVIGLAAVELSDQVLAYNSVPGEPDSAPLLVWCAATGRLTAVPEADIDPSWPDVVIVPGVAFTVEGDRLGQGGGWYDRYLSQVRADCVTVGVCFAEQVVDELPSEAHDVVVDHVVTDAGVIR